MLLWQMKPYIVDAVARHGLNTIANGQSSVDSAKSKQDSGGSGGGGSASGNGIEFELMLPGVNLPLEEISYYAISYVLTVFPYRPVRIS